MGRAKAISKPKRRKAEKIKLKSFANIKSKYPNFSNFKRMICMKSQRTGPRQEPWGQHFFGAWLEISAINLTRVLQGQIFHCVLFFFLLQMKKPFKKFYFHFYCFKKYNVESKWKVLSIRFENRHFLWTALRWGKFYIEQNIGTLLLSVQLYEKIEHYSIHFRKHSFDR